MVHLNQLGYEVKGLIRASSDIGLIPEELHPNIARIDYRHEKQVLQALEGYNAVFHLAGMTKAWSRKQLYRANVDVTRILLGAARKTESMKHFIYLSSQAVSGTSCCGNDFKCEDDPCRPVSGYGRSKRAAEKTVRRAEGIHCTIVRPASVFGPGDKDFLSYFRMVQKHVAVLLSGERSFSAIYSRDLVQFLGMLPLNDNAYGETFFVSDGKQYSFTGFVRYIEEAMKTFALKIYLPAIFIYPATFFSEIAGRFLGKIPVLNFQRIGDFTGKHWLCSSERAREILGWRPEYDIRDALRETYQWYIENNWL